MVEVELIKALLHAAVYNSLLGPSLEPAAWEQPAL